MKIASTALICFLLAAGGAIGRAQTTDVAAKKVADLQIELMRKDVRGQKKEIVAANLPLTTDEAIGEKKAARRKRREESGHILSTGPPAGLIEKLQIASQLPLIQP